MASSAVVVDRTQQRDSDAWRVVCELVLDGISSIHTRRSYSQALDEFLIWYASEPGRQFNKATVQRYRAELEVKGLAASSVNVRLSMEASDNGMLDPVLAAGVERAKGAKRAGVRVGNWLTSEQCLILLAAPDVSTIKGIRDKAILALLLGSGVRRSEVATLAVGDIQQREERWLIVDLLGKHGRIRTVPIPIWAYEEVVRWQSAARITEGPLFRAVTRHGQVIPHKLTGQAIYGIVRAYAMNLGLGISPHDLRRSFAHLAHAGDAPLEQIQLSLGHASVMTTELYLGVKQNLRDAPCDRLPRFGARTHGDVEL
jgi:site-specific recombinase XerD